MNLTFYLFFSYCLFNWSKNESLWATDGIKQWVLHLEYVGGKKKGSRLRAVVVLASHEFHSWLSPCSPSQGRNPFFLEPSVIITITDGNKLTHSSGVSDEVRTKSNANSAVRRKSSVHGTSESRVRGQMNFKANRWAACEEMKEEQEVIAIFSDANEMSVDAAAAVV